jgi:hypothetical protein
MKRHLLNLLTALSLMLCVAAGVLWVRSYGKTEGLCLTRMLDLMSDNGDLMLFTPAALLMEQDDEESGRPWPQWVSEPRDMSEEDDLYMKGLKEAAGKLGFLVGPVGFFGARVYAIAPWWSVTALFALTPLVRAGSAIAGRARAARRASRRVCRSCGYDLRATPGRCPECGTENPAAISN